jgi:SAM-dependent methyltransferase
MSLDFGKLTELLVCPKCHASLSETNGSILCSGCGLEFKPNENLYLDLVLNRAVGSIDLEDEAYVEKQKSDASRLCRDYLEPLLLLEPFQKVLNVGCGVGAELAILQEKGYEAYGIDLPYISKHWKQLNHDPHFFFCSDASFLPFPTGFFDVVYSFGVIEHIGTEIGHYTLSNDYREVRKKFAAELLRVTRRGGRIIINCPNKRFPIDIAHEPTDAAGPKRVLASFIKQHTNLTIHKIWGDYHLLSFHEIRSLFCNDQGGRSIEPLSLRNYFSFELLDRGFMRLLKNLVPIYINHLPRYLWSTCLDPYVCVLIKK